MALGELLPGLVAMLVFLVIVIGIVYLWYTERIPEYYVAAPISIIGFFGLAGIAMYPESTGGAWFFTLMAFGGAWVAYRDYTGESDDWGPTQVADERDGLKLVYQESLSSENKRWAIIKQEGGVTYCINKDGKMQEDNYFFEDRQSAINALKKSVDPLK